MYSLTTTLYMLMLFVPLQWNRGNKTYGTSSSQEEYVMTPSVYQSSHDLNSINFQFECFSLPLLDDFLLSAPVPAPAPYPYESYFPNEPKPYNLRLDDNSFPPPSELYYDPKNDVFRPQNVGQSTDTKGKEPSKEQRMQKKICAHCQAERTPQWRMGPMGPNTLCNACGLRYKSGKLVPEYRPAASPSFDAIKHSNFHRRIMKLKSRKDIYR